MRSTLQCVGGALTVACKKKQSVKLGGVAIDTSLQVLTSSHEPPRTRIVTRRCRRDRLGSTASACKMDNCSAQGLPRGTSESADGPCVGSRGSCAPGRSCTIGNSGTIEFAMAPFTFVRFLSQRSPLFFFQRRAGSDQSMNVYSTVQYRNGKRNRLPALSAGRRCHSRCSPGQLCGGLPGSCALTCQVRRAARGGGGNIGEGQADIGRIGVLNCYRRTYVGAIMQAAFE